MSQEPCNPFSVTSKAAFTDDEFIHRVSDGHEERRLQLPFPRRAALTVVLLELGYALAYAVDKESVNADRLQLM